MSCTNTNSDRWTKSWANRWVQCTRPCNSRSSNLLQPLLKYNGCNNSCDSCSSCHRPLRHKWKKRGKRLKRREEDGGGEGGEEAEDGGRGGGGGEDPEEGGGAAEEEEAGGALIHMVSHIFIQLYDVVYTWLYIIFYTENTGPTFNYYYN